MSIEGIPEDRRVELICNALRDIDISRMEDSVGGTLIGELNFKRI